VCVYICRSTLDMLMNIVHLFQAPIYLYFCFYSLSFYCRTLSRRAYHSVLGSTQIAQTPRSATPSVLQAHYSTINSCAPSDASLLSSLLDESSIQERTVVDSFWGQCQQASAVLLSLNELRLMDS